MSTYNGYLIGSYFCGTAIRIQQPESNFLPNEKRKVWISANEETFSDDNHL